MLVFFAVSRLAMSPNLFFAIGYSGYSGKGGGRIETSNTIQRFFSTPIQRNVIRGIDSEYRLRDDAMNQEKLPGNHTEKCRQNDIQERAGFNAHRSQEHILEYQKNHQADTG